MRTVAIIQARLNSSRLPAKVLAPIAGYPMLWHCWHRASQAHLVDDVMVATGYAGADLPIRAYCNAKGIPCFAGSEDDVLDRMMGAAMRCRADVVVRLTADCPMLDPLIIDAVIHAHQGAGVDYCANVCPPTWPNGVDTEAISFSALERAGHEATLPSEREHVTAYIRDHPERFRSLNVAHEPDLSGECWSVDTAADLAFVRTVFAELGQDFGMQDVLALLERWPDMRAINAGQQWRAAYNRQVAKVKLSRRRDK